MATTHGDLILTGGNRLQARSLQRRAAAGDLRRAGYGIYAVRNARPVEEIVCGAWAALLERYAPGAVLLGRTALGRTPWRAKDRDGHVAFPGWVFATDPSGSARRRISLPGLEIRTWPGAGALEGDVPFLGVHLASDARALLENLRQSRDRGGPSRTVGRAGVEREVERLLATVREDGLREILARAGRIAGPLDAGKELVVLRDVVAAVLGANGTSIVDPGVAARRRRTDPYDPECMDRLRTAATALGRIDVPDLADPHLGSKRRSCAAFAEAYFTNFIEGVRFPVGTALRIVFGDEPAEGRARDARDLIQTYAQLARIRKAEPNAASAAEFIDEIRERNAMLLDARPEKRPGLFKLEPNAAGNTVFVPPHLVEGTLREGFAMLRDVEGAFARGVFAQGLVVLVHPFDDGNGRTARIMTTRELVGGGRSRIVVPTIYRSDYIGGMRALSAPGNPQGGPLVRAMARCQSVTAGIVPADPDEAVRLWASTHAFLEDDREARLTEPDPASEVTWRKGVPAPAAHWAGIDLAATLGGSAAGVLTLDRSH